MTNVAEAGVVAIYPACWQTPGFSNSCCRIQGLPYAVKTELTESVERDGASCLILVLITLGRECLGENSNENQGPPSWVYDLCR